VIQRIADKHVRDSLYRALLVRSVVMPRTLVGDIVRPQCRVREDVDLALDVGEPKEFAREDGDGVSRVVDADEVGDLQGKID